MGGPAFIGSKEMVSTANFLEAPMMIECQVVVADDEHHLQQVQWKTCEHFFQAAKFDSDVPRGKGNACWEHCRKIQEQAKTPLDAWKLGQSRQFPLRPDWEEVKAHAMYIAVRAKYDQYPKYASKLAETTEPIHAEPSTKTNWRELNSIVLERVRYELRQLAGLEPLVGRQEYKEWCNVTSLPPNSKPIMVHLATSNLNA